MCGYQRIYRPGIFSSPVAYVSVTRSFVEGWGEVGSSSREVLHAYDQGAFAKICGQ